MKGLDSLSKEGRCLHGPLPDKPEPRLAPQAGQAADSQELRQTQPDAKLADAQFALAKDYGFPSWRALKAHVDSLSVDGQLFDAARRRRRRRR